MVMNINLPIRLSPGDAKIIITITFTHDQLGRSPNHYKGNSVTREGQYLQIHTKLSIQKGQQGVLRDLYRKSQWSTQMHNNLFPEVMVTSWDKSKASV